MSGVLRWATPDRLIPYFDPPVLQVWTWAIPDGLTLAVLAEVYGDARQILNDPDLAADISRRLGDVP